MFEIFYIVTSQHCIVLAAAASFSDTVIVSLSDRYFHGSYKICPVQAYVLKYSQ